MRDCLRTPRREHRRDSEIWEDHPRRHLKDFRGALQADAHSGFDHLYGDGAIYEVASWAHTGRKFHDIHVHLDCMGKAPRVQMMTDLTDEISVGIKLEQ